MITSHTAQSATTNVVSGFSASVDIIWNWNKRKNSTSPIVVSIAMGLNVSCDLFGDAGGLFFIQKVYQRLCPVKIYAGIKIVLGLSQRIMGI